MSQNNPIQELVEMRASHLDILHGLYWPKHDSGGWETAHQYPVTQDYFDNLIKIVDDSSNQHQKNSENSRQVMVQAGGNCGQYVKQYAKYFKTVYTFEPDPLNFVCLTLNSPDNVVKSQSCVGNEKKFIALEPFKHPSHDYHNGGIHVSGQGTLPTTIIDELDLPACDLIQLDIEGYEYFALLGAIKTIEKYHPVIVVEWFEAWAARYGVTSDMFTQFFANLGYKQVWTMQGDLVFTHTV